MNHDPNQAIALNGVTLSYASGDQRKDALHSIDLTIRQGEWAAIVGSNGCGKSTLAKVMAGLIPPSSGTITSGVTTQPAFQLVFQNPDTQIIGETVYEDVCFGLENFGAAPEEIEVRANRALRRVGLLELKDAPTSRLSGGQKQLLNIAGCLALDPSVYIFDEATSMLDPLSRQTILDAARQLHHEGRTIVWITQLLDELAWCGRVIAMHEGTIVFDGTKQQFFYGDEPAGQDSSSPCDRLGFLPPFTVQTARMLLKSGYALSPLPVSPMELSKAVLAL